MQPGPLKKRQREFDDANPSKTQKISIQVSSWDDLLKITADAEVPEDWERFVGELKKRFPDVLKFLKMNHSQLVQWVYDNYTIAQCIKSIGFAGRFFMKLKEQLLQSAFEEKKEFLGLSINSDIVDFAYAGFDRNFVLELKKLFVMEKVPVEKENRGTEIILSQEKTESEYLEKIVVDCWNIYATGKIYAPYFALVQSSGSGKTTCMNLISQNPNFIVQYILLNSVEPTDLATKFEGMIKKACEITETFAKGLICEFLEKFFDFKDPNNAAKIFVLCIDEARWLCDQEAKYHRNDIVNVFKMFI